MNWNKAKNKAFEMAKDYSYFDKEGFIENLNTWFRRDGEISAKNLKKLLNGYVENIGEEVPEDVLKDLNLY